MVSPPPRFRFSFVNFPFLRPDFTIRLRSLTTYLIYLPSLPFSSIFLSTLPCASQNQALAFRLRRHPALLTSRTTYITAVRPVQLKFAFIHLSLSHQPIHQLRNPSPFHRGLNQSTTQHNSISRYLRNCQCPKLSALHLYLFHTRRRRRLFDRIKRHPLLLSPPLPALNTFASEAPARWSPVSLDRYVKSQSPSPSPNHSNRSNPTTTGHPSPRWPSHRSKTGPPSSSRSSSRRSAARRRIKSAHNDGAC